MIKLGSWNVNSLKIRLEHVLNWMDEKQIDILALQETKLPDEQFPSSAFCERGYQVIFSGQKSYNGVAVISRFPITEVQKTIPDLEDPQKRILAVSFDQFRLINLYVPNGSMVNSDKYFYKLDWLKKINRYIKQQLLEYPNLAVVGDFNVAPEDQDVHSPEEWEGCVHVSPLERDAFKSLLNVGLYDSFRLFPQEERLFSWWDYRAASFRRNRGLRIDHILLSSPLVSRCISSNIDKMPRKLERPSDHAPIFVELKF